MNRARVNRKLGALNTRTFTNTHTSKENVYTQTRILYNMCVWVCICRCVHILCVKFNCNTFRSIPRSDVSAKRSTLRNPCQQQQQQQHQRTNRYGLCTAGNAQPLANISHSSQQFAKCVQLRKDHMCMKVHLIQMKIQNTKRVVWGWRQIEGVRVKGRKRRQGLRNVRFTSVVGRFNGVHTTTAGERLSRQQDVCYLCGVWTQARTEADFSSRSEIAMETPLAREESATVKHNMRHQARALPED